MNNSILFQSTNRKIKVTPSVLQLRGNNYPIRSIGNVTSSSFTGPTEATWLDILFYPLAILLFIFSMKFGSWFLGILSVLFGVGASFHLGWYLLQRERAEFHWVKIDFLTGKKIKLDLANNESAIALKNAIIQAMSS
ncbi:MAG: DUF6232 family protein [Bacteroidota bacterium]